MLCIKNIIDCFQMHAFTCGVDDLLLKRESDMDREAMLEKSEAQSEDVHCRFTGAKCGNIGAFIINFYKKHVPNVSSEV